MTVDPHVAAGFEAHRRALISYATKMVVREDVAEELVQEAALRALQQSTVPADEGELRAWLFRVVTNLAIDHLRRHSTWRESVLEETRVRANGDAGFVASSRMLAGSAESKTIAKDHLAVCFSCTLRNLSPEESAALLLKEVYDFTVDEVARVMDATFGQVKNRIQSARAKLTARYAETCALVAQRGACFQCVELDQFLDAHRGDPLAGTARDVDARLAIVRERRESRLGPWHRRMMRLVEEVLDDGVAPSVRIPRDP